MTGVFLTLEWVWCLRVEAWQTLGSCSAGDVDKLGIIWRNGALEVTFTVAIFAHATAVEAPTVEDFHC